MSRPNKMLWDPVAPNSSWAKFYGIEAKELLTMESEFYRMIEWDLSISMKSINKLCDQIMYWYKDF